MAPKSKMQSNGIGLTAEQYADMNRQVEAGYLESQGRLDDQLQRDLGEKKGTDLFPSDCGYTSDERSAASELGYAKARCESK